MQHPKLLTRGTLARAPLLSGIALAAAGPALGADATVSDAFDRLDADRNGSLSQRELDVDTSLRGSFATLDTNRDQRISGSEFRGSVSTTPGDPLTFDALDTNRDGRLTETELATTPGRSLDWFDSNRDGRVSRDEYDRGASAAPAPDAGGMDERRPATPRPDAGGTTRSPTGTGERDPGTSRDLGTSRDGPAGDAGSSPTTP
jgi:Ca2+-binding EF-hand superfamily protein